MKDLMAKQLTGRGWSPERVFALHSDYLPNFTQKRANGQAMCFSKANW
jgi:hypothetical protein